MNTVARLTNVTVRFATDTGPVYALDRLSLSVADGERVALVGESGAGKSVTALTMMDLLPTNAEILGDRVEVAGVDVLHASNQDRRRLRGGLAGMVFQEPMSALNPSMTVGLQVVEVLRAHQSITREVAKERVIELFKQVELPNPTRVFHVYPHELSGGMRQRVVICIAIACGPRLLIADEPTTALDVTVQREILGLFKRLTNTYSMSLLLVTHDLGIVAQTTDRVCVMYGGRIVENAPTKELFRRPQHPYTQGLLDAIPSRHSGRIRETPLREVAGTVSVLRSPAGHCIFAPRCPRSRDTCWQTYPPLSDIHLGHAAACFYPGRDVDGG